ncbi:MAG: hypothetical protein H5T86_02110 [Armatimonadetes bacterium]|nr:hypothetical protein [Armatimonadota bacterium]
MGKTMNRDSLTKPAEWSPLEGCLRRRPAKIIRNPDTPRTEAGVDGTAIQQIYWAAAGQQGRLCAPAPVVVAAFIEAPWA